MLMACVVSLLGMTQNGSGSMIVAVHALDNIQNDVGLSVCFNFDTDSPEPIYLELVVSTKLNAPGND